MKSIGLSSMYSSPLPDNFRFPLPPSPLFSLLLYSSATFFLLSPLLDFTSLFLFHLPCVSLPSLALSYSTPAIKYLILNIQILTSSFILSLLPLLIPTQLRPYTYSLHYYPFHFPSPTDFSFF
jgi:hypothetical protein